MKRIIKLLALLTWFSSYPQLLDSQSITQTLKGKVYDNESQSALAGAAVSIINTNPVKAVIADENGNFKIPNVPIGRYSIKITYVGYDELIIPEVLISSGKEVVLPAGLTQSVTHMNEVTVKSYSQKNRTVNTMASVSARSFTVEETRRYAGGLDDPARMVSAFAGVTVGNITDNAIIIRGNSPKSVSWRLEGVEIPNPNHFPGGNVAGGGVVTIFSSQLLATSDFFTGAFPAEYGNALGGVFDMRLRNGNSEQHEHTIQTGMMGIDIASEGPFKKGNPSSYLFNYRYSTTGILSNLKLIPTDQVPKYQDLSFKLNFPTRRAGVFSFWGIGGIDNNNEPVDNDSMKWNTDWDRVHYDWKLLTGASGLSHKYLLNSQSYINSTVATSGTNNIFEASRYDNSMHMRPHRYIKDNYWKITANSYLNTKINSQNTLRAGATYSEIFYKVDISSTTNDLQPETYSRVALSDGHSSMLEGYLQLKSDITSWASVNLGLNSSYFALNKSYSFDPRASISWNINKDHNLTLGYGKHSQLEPLKVYFVKQIVDGIESQPNKDLDYSQSHHIVLAYEWKLNDLLRIKVEPYYQYLYNIPGEKGNSYSIINYRQEMAFSRILENNGEGKNYGVDFTFERLFNKNFYYMISSSVFQSKYKADDDIWRNTRYNKGFTFNVLGGKEFFFKNNRIFGINARFNYIGGERYIPFDEAQSIAAREIIEDPSRAFDSQYPGIYYLDFTITYKINKSRYSGTWALQIKNALGAPNYHGHEYNYKTNSIVDEEFTVILPVLSYKIEF